MVDFYTHIIIFAWQVESLIYEQCAELLMH